MDVSVALVGFPETSTGFRMAGVTRARTITRGSDVQMRTDTLDAMKELLGMKGIGVIIINETLADMIRDEFEGMRAPDSVYPILVEVPSAKGTPEGRVDPVRALIRRATGVEEL